MSGRVVTEFATEHTTAVVAHPRSVGAQGRVWWCEGGGVAGLEQYESESSGNYQ